VTAIARPVGAAVRPERRWDSRAASVADTNMVTLVRPPRFNDAEGLTEFTVAGHAATSSGKILPWYHKVLVDRKVGDTLVAGMPVEVLGALDQHKFQVAGEAAKRSIIRVIADSVAVLDAAQHPVSQRPTPTGETSFILDGGVNEVRLGWNLSQNAELFTAPSGDPYARLHIALEGERLGRKKTSYLLVKAWRDQVAPVGSLKKGARLGLAGMLLSEKYPDGKGVMRNAVLVEVIRSNVRS
jgi:single-stranded DNA-binding protein